MIHLGDSLQRRETSSWSKIIIINTLSNLYRTIPVCLRFIVMFIHFNDCELHKLKEVSLGELMCPPQKR